MRNFSVSHSLTFSLSLFLGIYLSLSRYLYLYLSIYLSISISLSLSLFLSWSLSLFSLSLSLYSLYPFSSCFFMLSLSLVLTLLSLSPPPPFWPMYGVCPQWERLMWTRKGKGNDNSWVLEPGQGDRYKFRTQFSTLSILFLIAFWWSLSLVLTLLSLSTSSLFFPRDGVWTQG